MTKKQREALRAWIIAHPIQGALTLGIGWGLICGSVSALRTGDWLLILVAFSLVGVLGFGPYFVYLTRRRERRAR